MPNVFQKAIKLREPGNHFLGEWRLAAFDAVLSTEAAEILVCRCQLELQRLSSRSPVSKIKQSFPEQASGNKLPHSNICNSSLNQTHCTQKKNKGFAGVGPKGHGRTIANMQESKMHYMHQAPSDRRWMEIDEPHERASTAESKMKIEKKTFSKSWTVRKTVLLIEPGHRLHREEVALQ